MSLQQFNVGLYVGLEHFRFTATLIILVVSLIIRQSTLQRKNSAPKHCFKYRTNRYKHPRGTKLSLKATWPPPGHGLCPSMEHQLSLSCSQGPAAGSCLQSDTSSPHPYTLFLSDMF